jgi:adenine-specific DNA-methyltransferase
MRVSHVDPLPSLEIDRKRNGVFYTPQKATRILCNWAIRSGNDYVLEPSFGGCSFLASSQQRLSHLDCERPEKNLFGCDIDPKAFQYLSQTVKPSDLTRRFLLQDFLKLTPASFCVPAFNAVIGNPPYVSHHAMSIEQREAATQITVSRTLSAPNKPSLWANFILHSLGFLIEGARCAWLLPTSILFTDYARDVRQHIRNSFSRSLIVVLGERIFLSEGTKERTVVLLCEDWHATNTNGSMEIGFAADLHSLASLIDKWSQRRWQGSEFNRSPNLALMNNESLTYYTELISRNLSKTLGQFCKIRIGLVTGANKFFVLNVKQAEAENIPFEALCPVLSKFGDTSGLQITKRDFKRLQRLGKHCLLVDPSQVRKISASLKRYLDKFPSDERERNITFKKRKFWHSANDSLVPDAFLSYMHKTGPALLLNTGGLNCTNTIHRVFFEKKTTRIIKKAIAVSIQSTFSQLSAEIEGRSYGGGLLKHEPSEASKIKILLPSLTTKSVEVAYARVHSLLRLGLSDAARKEADRFILKDCTRLERSRYAHALESALTEARARRVRSNSPE